MYIIPKIVSPAVNIVVTVAPQVVITTTHGVASDDKGGQTDDPQSKHIRMPVVLS